jgi:hypothetical protein
VGTGGIIFMAILGLWAVYLIPVLVKERASRLDSRADDRTSAAVRVLQRPAAERPSRRVVLTVDRPVVSDRMPARPTRDLATTLRRDARRTRLGVRLRGLAALAGLVALVAGVIAAGAGVAPWWVPVAAVGWLTGVVVTGAVTTALRRRAVAPVTRVPALEPRARRVATEVFDDRVVRATGPRITEVVRPAPVAASTEVEDTGWTPVEVPGPVYASKPASHRPPALPWSMPPAGFAGAEPGEEPAADAPGAAATAATGPAAGGPAADAAQPEPTVDDEPAEERRSAAG